MKVLIVSAHPEEQSFSCAMQLQAVKTLEANSHEVITSDLYKTNWNPIASSKDFIEPKNSNYLTYALEQRHGFENATLAPDIQGELDKLQWCDMLILNFPLYWGSMPAIMKGWIDRVFVSGLCYGGKRIYDQGGLAGKKAMCSITLGAQPHMFADEDSIHGALNDMIRHILRGTLAYVGFEVLPPFLGWHVPYISHEDRIEILHEYDIQLRNLDKITPLEFPKISQFDKYFRPLKPELEIIQ